MKYNIKYREDFKNNLKERYEVMIIRFIGVFFIVIVEV